MSNNLIILWISDLHMDSRYFDADRIEQFNLVANYTNSLIEQLEKHLTQNEYSVDYILITGDLAQSGTSADYDAFSKLILIKLFDLFLKIEKKHGNEFPRLITIPGNHDVNWKAGDFIGEYFKEYYESDKKFEFKQEYFNKKVNEFTLLFEDYILYSTVTIPNLEGGIYRDALNFSASGSKSVIVSKNYNENRLYGYVVDKRKRTIFVLLNSAWYSLGVAFDELLIKNRLLDPDFVKSLISFNKWLSSQGINIFEEKELDFSLVDALEKYADEFKDKKYDKHNPDIINYFRLILKFKEIIIEYNNQISGINLLLKEDLLSIFEDLSDYIVITCMHHPLNWLHWNEKFTMSEDPDSPSHKLKELFLKSDLFLSGHEHYPIAFSENTNFGNTVFLKGGCFLENLDSKNFDLNRYWLSLLNIDFYRNTLVQTKIFNKYDLEKFAFSWEFLKQRRIKLENRENINTLTDKRISNIVQLLEDYNVMLFVKQILPQLFQYDPLEILQIDKFSECDCILFKHAETIELCILAKQKDFYFNIGLPLYLKYIDDTLKNSVSKIESIRLVTIDLFVDEKLGVLYNGKKIDRRHVISSIMARANVLFDKFRHKFFIRFEPGLGKEDLEKVNYWDLKFINVVLPYWEFESNFSQK